VATSSSSSSAKKVAKLAQKDKGKKVRFQGGTLFPAIIIGILVVGLLTIGYARQSRPDPGSFPPQVGDHWHAAYGMYVCDGWLPKLTGNQEETVTDSTGQKSYVNPLFGATGVHSHDDGVIHYHPYTTKSVGQRARLGVFLNVYGVKLSTSALILPADQGGDSYKVGDYKCNGKDVEIKVIAWDNYADTGKGTTYITDLTNVRITRDGMVFVIAVVPQGTDVSMPPWASELPQLGSADGGNVPTTTVAGQTGTTVASGSTIASGSTVASATTAPSSTATTTPTTNATTTTGG
jgi:hypothetical protein